MANSSLSLDRLLNTPHLDRIIPRLQPEVLLRVIGHYGLDHCAELVALASPAQIASLLDADVWRVRAGTTEEAFDVERFGLWLAVLMQSGVAVAADKLAGIMGLSCYLVLASQLTAERLAANQATPIFLAHGMQDPVVAPVLGEDARRQLLAAGYTVEWHTYSMPHSVCPQEVSDIAAWLRRVL